MKSIMLTVTFILVFLITLLGTNKAEVAQTRTSPPQQDNIPDTPTVFRVYYDNLDQLHLLNEFDLFEYNNLAEKYVLVAVNESERNTLKALGYQLSRDEQETAAFNRQPSINRSQENGIPGFACYRTVAETYATAVSIVDDNPNLASWIDIGDSWEKNQNINAGHDLRVLKLTNKSFPEPKPKIFIMSALHAREYATAELNTRFAEMLTRNYNDNADINWLLNYHEIHLLLQANPDGRIHAEEGLLWRKNTNQSYCSPDSIDRGVDLNRNFTFQWNCCNGSSSSQCSDTYHGPTPASEPEVQAIQNYVRNIFPDQRGDLLTDPAPDNAMGVFLDIHSFSQLVLWPWGWDDVVAPNGPALQTFGRKMAYFNNYRPDQAISLYPTDGTTDDFAYGELGLAAYTFELGTEFFQSCADFENSILPDNLSALLYAAKAAQAPYQLPAGPEVTAVSIVTDTIMAGTPVTLTAVIDDTRFNQSNGQEAVQNIAAAELYIDMPHWDVGNNPSPMPMTAADGAFDRVQETAVATIDTSNLSNGRHTLFIRGQDSDGNWGMVTAVYLHIFNPNFANHQSWLPLLTK